MSDDFKYSVFSYTLDSEVTDIISIKGGYICAIESSDASAYLNIQIQGAYNDSLKLRKGRSIVANFDRLYISAPAQTGKSIKIIVANSFSDFAVIENEFSLTRSKITPLTGSKSSSGDNTILAVATGSKYRINYFCFTAHGDVTVTLQFGSTAVYTLGLKDGSVFARALETSGRYLEGLDGEDIVINLDAAIEVDYTIEGELL